MQARGKWSIKRGSYLSYDLGVTPKTSEGRRKEERGVKGGKGETQRSV